MSGTTEGAVRVIDSAVDCPRLPIIVGEGTAVAAMWPGNGAKWRTFNVLDIKAGSQTIDLQHPSDSVYYVRAGAGVVIDIATGRATQLAEGTMLHIDRGDAYRFEAASNHDLLVIGGPCPADERLYQHLKGA
ncbi:hypothetical protein [Mesorhizobium sp. SP-1A]|uniref:hypothetical protein n=1 Tax=Mesorhizobium sp. SP-1A TaxID=3077840 RepID=UPI0028F6EFFD|nr:hypothetical protein [Mesorhizobium sp. SP-1A]